MTGVDKDLAEKRAPCDGFAYGKSLYKYLYAAMQSLQLVLK